tara:strand:+ start:93 stop:1019 length:927 start_codon:yes stop_codon:yes gene_type:complete
MNLIFVVTRLWRYLNIYFLKPFDAVNDTLTSYLIFNNHSLKNNYIELGSGDGMFSYIMCGGKFPLEFDRYLDVKLSQKDIFDVHKKNFLLNLDVKKTIRPLISIDAKKNHVIKIKQIGFSKKAVLSSYEKLTLKKESTKLIFYYTAHGVKNFNKSVNSALKILKKNGRIIFLVFDDYVKKNFLCYFLYRKGFLKNFFKNLDNNRFKEISSYSKKSSEWRIFFKSKGLKIINESRGLSGVAWQFYDIQTRPILKLLILFFNFFPKNFRRILKFVWMITLYPFLLIFFIVFSNLLIKSNNNCYLVFELKK